MDAGKCVRLDIFGSRVVHKSEIKSQKEGLASLVWAKPLCSVEILQVLVVGPDQK